MVMVMEVPMYGFGHCKIYGDVMLIIANILFSTVSVDANAATLPSKRDIAKTSAVKSNTIAPSTRLSDIAVRLRQNGVAACAPQINAAGATILAGASQYDTLSNWNSKGGDQRSVNVVVAQRYPEKEPIPSGVSTIVATPVSPGRCDLVAVQVVPSPLSCDAVRNAMTTRAQARGQLVGVTVMQQGPTETLLVPTGTDTCVVVDLTTTYAQ
ncbi:hypothetical protein [Sphingomonas aurantiaca]|uniref:hypothetical protein n=1 Tax=Sphingomonas aurantiaca TaxID=185949 RepID=UPI003365097A